MSTPFHGADASEEQRYVDWYMWEREDRKFSNMWGSGRRGQFPRSACSSPAGRCVRSAPFTRLLGAAIVLAVARIRL